MSLYAVTMARFGHRRLLSESLSGPGDAAKACARFVHDRRERVVVSADCGCDRDRYSVRSPRLRSRMRSVTACTRWCSGMRDVAIVVRSVGRISGLGPVWCVIRRIQAARKDTVRK